MKPFVKSLKCLFVPGKSTGIGRTEPPVHIEIKVAFQHKLFILKRNFCFDVNRRFGPSDVSTCNLKAHLRPKVNLKEHIWALE